MRENHALTRWVSAHSAVFQAKNRMARDMQIIPCSNSEGCMKTKKLLTMKMPLLQIRLIVWLSFPLVAIAQGTFVFDQQSSDESNGGLTGVTIQSAQPVGQSFTPSLDGVRFVRLHLLDVNRGNGLGATVYVNIRSDSITGTILASTEPLNLPDGWGSPTTGYVDFLFPTTVAVQPGTTYFFQPVVQSGDSWGMLGDAFNYPGGTSFVLGNPNPAIDYWFREGVVVPEPSPCVLILFFAAGWPLCRRHHQRGGMA